MDNLNQFGYSFQVKVLTSLITDRDFLIQSLDLIKPEYFDNQGIKFLVEKTFLYFKEYKLLPSKDVFKVQVQSIQNNETLRKEVINTLQESVKYIQSDDLGFVKQEVIKFSQNQLVKKAYEDSLVDFQQGNYDLIVQKFNQAIQTTNQSQKLGHNLIEDFEYRYTDEAEPEKIATGFEVLDEALNGGLPKGTMGIIIAPSGIGKSWLLAKFGANAVKSGKNVLHITLELKDTYTAKRYDSILSGIPFNDLKYHQDEVRKVITKLKGKAFIHEFPPSTLSFTGLEALIEKYKLAGFDIDEVFVDYPELMKIDFTGVRDDNVLKNLYNDLTGLAGRQNFALWIVDQTNRDNADKDIIGNSGISNAFSKVFIATVVMTLSRKIKDKMNNTARLHLSKSRLGPDGITFPMKFDTYAPFFEVYDPKSSEGSKVKGETLSDDEYERKVAAQAYMEQQKRKNNLF